MRHHTVTLDQVTAGIIATLTPGWYRAGDPVTVIGARVPYTVAAVSIGAGTVAIVPGK